MDKDKLACRRTAGKMTKIREKRIGKVFAAGQTEGLAGNRFENF